MLDLRNPSRPARGPTGEVPADRSSGATTQFAVLGPLEIRRDGRPLECAAKPRTLLAALLLGANRVRTSDWLVAALWDDEPPRSARNLLARYVGELRRMLDLGPERISTRPAGYVLEVDPARLDLWVFDERVRHARARAEAGDPASASTALSVALALWRGPALSDVPSQLLHETEVPRLTEARRDAELLWVDAELRLGRHEAVLPALTRLAAEFPLAEDFHRLQMVALYRAGRRGEALAVYQRARMLLRTELGVEPGRQLQETAKAVRDDTLSAVASPAPAFTPAELPRLVPDFIGRQAEVVRLAEMLVKQGTGPPVAVITGPGGVGKSVLALRVSWQLRARFPDGQLYADLRAGAASPVQPAQPADVLAMFLDGLGIGPLSLPADLAARGRLFRTFTADRRLLVLLDDALDEDQVRLLLPTGPGCAAVVTSRRRLPGLDGAAALALGVLPGSQALQLLERVAGGATTTRTVVDDDPAAARELVRLCGNLPLAVRVAGVRLAGRSGWTAADLVRRLTDERRLDELVAGGVTVRASLEVSYRECDQQARKAFRRLALLPAVPAPAWVVAAAAGVEGPVDRILDQLIEYHLVTESGRDRLGRQRFDCHGLLLTLARERLADEDAPLERAAALRSVFAGYAAAAALAARTNGEDLRYIDPADVNAEVPAEVAEYAAREPIRWYRAERDGLIAAVSAAARAAADGVVETSWVWRLAFALVPLAKTACDWSARAEVLDLAMVAAERAGDRTAVIVARTAAGELAADQSDWPTAQRHLSEAIRQTGDERVAGTALATTVLGVMHRDSGRPMPAIQLLSRALEEFRASGDIVGQLRALRGLALAQYDIGCGRRALCTFAEFRRLAEPLGYPWTAMLGTDLAKVYRGLGRLEPALAELTAALPQFVTRENPAWQGATLYELGEVLRALGRPEEALSRFREAREIFVRVRDQHWLGRIEGAIGDTYVALGHHDDALDRYRAAQHLLALFDDRRSLERVTAAIEALAHSS